MFKTNAIIITFFIRMLFVRIPIIPTNTITAFDIFFIKGYNEVRRGEPRRAFSPLGVLGLVLLESRRQSQTLSTL